MFSFAFFWKVSNFFLETIPHQSLWQDSTKYLLFPFYHMAFSLDSFEFPEDETLQLKRGSGWLKRKHQEVKSTLRSSLDEPAAKRQRLTSPKKRFEKKTFEKKAITRNVFSQIRISREQQEILPLVNLFKDINFYLSNGVLSDRSKLVKLITQGGGKTVAFVNKQTNFFVVQNREEDFSNKMDTLKQHQIPVLLVDWIYDSIKENYLIMDDRYYVWHPGSEPEESEEQKTAEEPRGFSALFDSRESEDETQEEENANEREELQQEMHQQSFHGNSHEEAAPSSAPAPKTNYRPRHWGLTKIYPYKSSSEPYFHPLFKILRNDTLSVLFSPLFSLSLSSFLMSLI